MDIKTKFIIASAMLTATAFTGSLADDNAAQKRIEIIKEAGYTYENCFMKGRPLDVAYDRVSGLMQFETPGKFSVEHFPYRWDFSDGTTSGAYPMGGAADFKVENGKLTFTSGDESSCIAWGSIIPSEPALSFGYPDRAGYSAPALGGVRLRIKQSLPESEWWIAIPPYGRVRRREIKSRTPTVIEGTDWQEVVIGGLNHAGPWPGIQIGTDTPGNKIEIDWVIPESAEQLMPVRKTLDLPAEVEWAKLSISSSTEGAEIYINGRKAVKTYPGRRPGTVLWNYDLEPGLFRKGKNVVLAMSGANLLVDAALLCKDGTYIRFDTDETWKRPRLVPAGDNVATWSAADFDDAEWVKTQIQGRAVYQTEPERKWVEVDDETWFYSSITDINGSRIFFNPSWKGRITAGPSDRRTQPVFGSSEDIALRISVPFRQGVKQEVTYRIYDQMGDDLVPEDKLVKEGVVTLKKEGIYNTGETRVKQGELPYNIAYAVVLTFSEDGEDVEKYNYEIAVCGPLDLPEIENPEHYTDGMNLKLVWGLDAAAEQKDGYFISCLGDTTEAPAPVIETPLGRFRTTNPDRIAKTEGGCDANFISFKYRIENPGRPHVAIAEYPDDTIRFQEMRLNDGFEAGGTMTIGNDGVVIGIPTPPSHSIKHHHTLFFPNSRDGTITFFGMGVRDYYKPEQAAHVGKIRIYEVIDDVPVRKINDAPGETRWFGQHPERGPRQIVSSCFSSPAAPYFMGYAVLVNNSPYFYRNWMITFRNMVRRLQFAGENAYFMGQVMYGNMLYPSKYSNDAAFDHGRTPGEMRDYGVLMAKMFEENEMGWFSSLQLTKLPTIHRTCPDSAVMAGCDTLGVVSRDGRTVEGFRGISPNWLRPECREVYNTMINELLDLYGGEKGWKGIKLYINQANGPAWATWEDPLMTSYDDFTIALFEKETGIKLPDGLSDKSDSPDPDRFTKRYEWLIENAKDQWIRWRADKMNEIYTWTRDRLVETRPDLKLVLFIQLEGTIIPDLTKPITTTTHQRALAHGYDLDGLKKEKNIVTSVCVWGNPATDSITAHFQERPAFARSQALARNHEYIESLADDGKSGISFRVGWYEPQPGAPENWVWHRGSHAEAWPYSQGASLAENWINIFIRSNPTLIIHSMQDATMWVGREYYTARFAAAYRSIPNTVYTRITTNGLDGDLWVSAGKYKNDIYGYIANPFWWKMDLELELFDGITIEDLVSGSTPKKDKWALTLDAYEIRTFRLTGGADRGLERIFASARIETEEVAVDYIRELIEENMATITRQAEIIEKAPGLGGKLDAWWDKCKTLFQAGRYGEAYENLILSVYSPRLQQLAWELPGYEPLLAEFPPVRGTVAIDGKFEDWTGLAPVFEMNARENILISRGEEWQGPEDLSVKGFAQWDDQFLYFAVDVTDDDLQPALYRGDSVELYFDMDLYGNYGCPFYADNHFNFKFAPVLMSSEVKMDIRQGDNGAKRLIPDNGGITAAWNRTPHGYMMEIAIPWKTLLGEEWRFGKPEAGMKFGFDAMAIDLDEDMLGPRRLMFWSTPKTPFNDPRTFGRAVLADQ